MNQCVSHFSPSGVFPQVCAFIPPQFSAFKLLFLILNWNFSLSSSLSLSSFSSFWQGKFTLAHLHYSWKSFSLLPLWNRHTPKRMKAPFRLITVSERVVPFCCPLKWPFMEAFASLVSVSRRPNSTVRKMLFHAVINQTFPRGLTIVVES